jgi:uncharacterized protein (DUF433 family)
VSTEKVKLWSHADLMGLRIIYWLRQRKTSDAGGEVPRTSMKAIRRALGRLRALDAQLGELDQPSLWVDESGDIQVKGPGGPETLAGQMVVADAINLIAPFSTKEGLRGPDLVRPRPELRIAPGRLSGSPHLVHTRLETRALYALDRDGLDASAIRMLYPYVTAKQLAEALDLERQLEANLAIRDAA